MFVGMFAGMLAYILTILMEFRAHHKQTYKQTNKRATSWIFSCLSETYGALPLLCLQTYLLSCLRTCSHAYYPGMGTNLFVAPSCVHLHVYLISFKKKQWAWDLLVDSKHRCLHVDSKICVGLLVVFVICVIRMMQFTIACVFQSMHSQTRFPRISLIMS